jgi:hypothetical protein
VIEFTEVGIEVTDLGACGSEVVRTVSLPMLKGENGTQELLYRTIFTSMNAITAKLQNLDCSISSMDLNVGIPLRGYEADTAECCVIYFNDQRTGKQGIGRYTVIPVPNVPALIGWGAGDPFWSTGNWYTYAQYDGSKGAKIAVFGNSAGTAEQQLETLLTLTKLPSERLYFRGKPRETSSKSELLLRVKRITFFPSAKEKSGRQQGEVVFTNPKID